jgi:small subunit ribosomal protein S5
MAKSQQRGSGGPGPGNRGGGPGQGNRGGESGRGGERNQRGDGNQQKGPQTGGFGSGGGEDGGLEENVVRISRCATVVKGGRRFSFGALVVVGDRRGRVGIGYGKSIEVPSAVEKAKKIASRNLIKVRLAGATLPHKVVGKFGASRVVLVPASAGTGVIAGTSVRAVLELAGVHDVLTKSFGSNGPKNLVQATLNGLTSLMHRDDIERLRGVKIAG